MNQADLKLAAEHLQQVAEALIDSGHREVEPFLAALRPLVEQAINQRITVEMAWGQVPGHWLMSETSLRGLPQLETAYAEFKIQITGSAESPVLRRLKQMKGEQ